MDHHHPNQNNGGSRASSSDQLFQAQTHIYKHMYSFIESMSLKCAVQLSIPDIIHNHNHNKQTPITLLDLASSLNIPQSKTNSLARLLRILVHSGFLSLDERGGYALTPCSTILVRDSPTSLSPAVMAFLDPLLVNSWFSLADWLRGKDEIHSSSTPFETHVGKGFWDYAKENEGFIGSLDEAMASDSKIASSLVGDHGEVFEGLGSLVDVGGGSGTMARAVCEKFPLVDCVVLDLPRVVEGLADEKRLRFVGGDMFESVPSADGVLIKSVLHNWRDEECVKILKRCREAIRAGKGKLILIEMVIDEGENEGELSKTRLFMDMEMMMLCQGKERTEAEWENLFLESGFTRHKITPTAGLNSIIEVYP